MKFENHQYYNCEILLDNGETYKISANYLYNQGLDRWQGWLCDAGHLRLHIDKDLNVFSAVCENEPLGNVLEEWKIYDQPSVCLRSRCTGCADDLMMAKRDPKHNSEFSS